MPFPVLYILILSFYVVINVRADAAPMNECHENALPKLQLKQLSCATNDGVVLLKFTDNQQTASPYATDFDKRSVVVASGKDANSVKKVAGLIGNNKTMRVSRTALAQPPAPDQIASRKPVRKAQLYKKWKIWTEQIQYGAQGGAQGFVLDCATAYRSDGNTVAVSECFALENRELFIKTLDAVSHQ